MDPTSHLRSSELLTKIDLFKTKLFVANKSRVVTVLFTLFILASCYDRKGCFILVVFLFFSFSSHAFFNICFLCNYLLIIAFLFDFHKIFAVVFWQFVWQGIFYFKSTHENYLSKINCSLTKHIAKIIFLPRINCIWWWGSSSGDLRSIEYLFITIIPRFILLNGLWDGRQVAVYLLFFFFGVTSRICSKQGTAFLCCSHLAFSLYILLESMW